MTLLIAAFALLISEDNPPTVGNPMDNPKAEANHAWRGRAQLKALEVLGEQKSDRIVFIRGQEELNKFWGNVTQFGDDAKAPKVDFSKELVAVIKNQRYLNPMRFVKREENESQKSVTIVVRETRSARPFRGSFYFVAVTVSRSTKLISDGVTSVETGLD
jgi:BMFP domain-containing protein YqiC